MLAAGAQDAGHRSQDDKYCGDEQTGRQHQMFQVKEPVRTVLQIDDEVGEKHLSGDGIDRHRKEGKIQFIVVSNDRWPKAVDQIREIVALALLRLWSIPECEQTDESAERNHSTQCEEEESITTCLVVSRHQKPSQTEHGSGGCKRQDGENALGGGAVSGVGGVCDPCI
ncbi:MAG: hypothetical protein IIZ65_00500 [Clostridia bacterium]|nr:hypothetical protein [Clostridia bacterium]